MASSTWLVQSCSLGTLVCHLCDGEGMSSLWHAGPGMLPSLPATPQGLWEPHPQDQHCQKEGGRHVVRFWLLPCLETLVGGGSIKLP